MGTSKRQNALKEEASSDKAAKKKFKEDTKVIPEDKTNLESKHNIKAEPKRKTKAELKEKTKVQSEKKEKVESKKKEKVESKKAQKKLTIDTQEEFALAYQLINKEKTLSTLVDEGHHKNIFNDTDSLPKWFVDEEKKHSVKQIPITREVAIQYRKEREAIDSRPIKKIVEAKARRKNKHLRKMKKLTDKANAIVENSEISEKEKASTIHKILAKKTMKAPGRKTTFVVTKNKASTHQGRPKGVKGRYKKVDSRMKKDLRAQKIKKNKTKKK